MTDSNTSDPVDLDITLAERLRCDDIPVAAAAFEILFNTYVDDIVRFVYRYVRSIEAARDIAHDVFARVWERRKLLPNRNLAPYLFRAARNRAIDVVDHEIVVQQWELDVQHDPMTRNPSDVNSAEQQLELSELAERLNAALAKLTPRMREIVLLNHQEGLKPGQIAKVLGISPATVYVKLSRALKQLARDMKDV
jgi:RNA polymerase sigma-70 factor (ECF subfamily)